MSNAIRELETAAVDAHRAGWPWATFWDSVRKRVAALESSGAEGLREKLLHLWATGEPDGMLPPPMTLPWERDGNAANPHDTQTAARCCL